MYLPKSEATTLGPFDQTRKNDRTTNVYLQDPDTQQLASRINSPRSPMKTNIVLVSIIHPVILIYSDLTGRFPFKSAKVN